MTQKWARLHAWLQPVNPVNQRLRFKINYNKCIQGIQLLAKHMPGITQYYVGKTFFFADREHFLDWGRPISGDRYVAMEHGPVPSEIYNLVKLDAGNPDELIDLIRQRVVVEHSGNKIHLYARDDVDDFTALSASDQEYLLTSLEKHGEMSFGRLKALSHEDPAYEEAWALPGINNEMDLRLWLRKLDDYDGALASVNESSAVRRIGAMQ